MSVIKRCYWKGQMIDCALIFVTRPTDRGMCCTFNQEQAEKIFKTTMYGNITIPATVTKLQILLRLDPGLRKVQEC